MTQAQLEAEINRLVGEAQAKAAEDLRRQKEAAERELERQRAAAQSALLSERDSYQELLTKQASAVQATARDLDNMLAGFLTGAIPKAYGTERAGVQTRDPFRGMETGYPEAPKKGSSSGILFVVAGITLFFFVKKGRKNGLF